MSTSMGVRSPGFSALPLILLLQLPHLSCNFHIFFTTGAFLNLTKPCLPILRHQQVLIR